MSDLVSANKNLIMLCKSAVDNIFIPALKHAIGTNKLSFLTSADDLNIINTYPTLLLNNLTTVVVQESDNMVCIGLDLRKSVAIKYDMVNPIPSVSVPVVKSFLWSLTDKYNSDYDNSALAVSREGHIKIMRSRDIGQDLKHNVEFCLGNPWGEVTESSKKTWYYPILRLELPFSLVLEANELFTKTSNLNFLVAYTPHSLNLADLCKEESPKDRIEDLLYYYGANDIAGLNWRRINYRIRNSCYVTGTWKRFIDN